MYFFAFNLEKFTPDRIFYTGSARGARDKYEVCNYDDDDHDADSHPALHPLPREEDVGRVVEDNLEMIICHLSYIIRYPLVPTGTMFFLT